MLFSELRARAFAPLSRVFVRFASKKQGGSTSNGRDSNPKFLGLKAGGGEARGRPRRGAEGALLNPFALATLTPPRPSPSRRPCSRAT